MNNESKVFAGIALWSLSQVVISMAKSAKRPGTKDGRKFLTYLFLAVVFICASAMAQGGL